MSLQAAKVLQVFSLPWQQKLSRILWVAFYFGKKIANQQGGNNLKEKVGIPKDERS